MALLFFRPRRITTSVAPELAPPVDVKVLPAYAWCCGCCVPPCPTPDRHTTACDVHGDAS